MYRHHDTKFRYKTNWHATRFHKLTRLWLRRTRKVTLPKIYNESSREVLINIAQNSTYDNTACLSHTEYDNNNYAHLPDTEIGNLVN